MIKSGKEGHVTSRGNTRKPIFKDDADSNSFLDAAYMLITQI